MALGYGDAYLASDSWGLYVTTGDLAIQGEVVDHNDQPIHSVQVEGSFGSYLPGQYVLTPTLTDRVFAPPTHTINLPQGTLPAQFIAIAAPITATVGSTQEVEIEYLDIQGLPTSFYIPSGTFSTTTLIEVTPVLASDTPEALFAGHGFILETRTGTAPVTHFGEPISISISYSDLDIFGVSNEAELRLRWWDGEVYRDAAESCSPGSIYQRDLGANTISIAVCRSGEYALMGPIIRIYLPFVLTEAD